MNFTYDFPLASVFRILLLVVEGDCRRNIGCASVSGMRRLAASRMAISSETRKEEVLGWACGCLPVVFFCCFFRHQHVRGAIVSIKLMKGKNAELCVESENSSTGCIWVGRRSPRRIALSPGIVVCEVQWTANRISSECRRYAEPIYRQDHRPACLSVTSASAAHPTDAAR